MNEITYDKVEDEKSPVIKQLYWNIAFGLQDVDGLKPSRYMVELSQEHINGKKTYYQVQEEITSYYKKNSDNHIDDDEEEADEVATAIYEILNNKPFLNKKMSQNISVFNRVVVVVLTLTFLYINYKNIEIAKIKNKKDLTPFKLQITASELSTVAAIIVLYTVLTSGEYSVIAGAENPSL